MSFLLLLLLAQTPVFEEPFSFGLTHAWRVVDSEGSSHWHVKEGVLRQSSSIAESHLLLTEAAFSSGTLLARIASQHDGGMALLFRVRDDQHYYRILFHQPPGEERPIARLEKKNGADITVLASHEEPLAYPFGPWWIVAVEMNAGHFRVLLNGDALFEARDGEFEEGGIGISCLSNAGARVDALAFYEEELRTQLLGPRPALLKGPFMGCLGPHGFTVTWETSIPAPSSLEIILGTKSRRIEGGDEKRLFHELAVDGLEPGLDYRYKVLSGPMVSPVYSVRTPPLEFDRFSFCAYGDSRSAPDPHRFVIRSMRMRTPDFILHMGDLVTRGSRYEDWAPEFFEPADWLIHSLPFYVSMGNHEQSGPWFNAFVPLPGNHRYYDFNHGNAYFMALDSCQSLEPGSPQLDWIKKASTSDRARSACWRFCHFHHPPFSESRKGYRAPKGVKEVVPLLMEAGFDILFSGHNHNYERGQIGDLRLVVTGGGGAPLCYGEHYRARDIPEITLTRSVHHACLVEVDGSVLNFTAFTPDGRVIDSFKLEK